MNPDCLNLFFADCTDEPAVISRYWQVLSEEERNKADRFRCKRDRHISIIARGMLRYLLSIFIGKSPESFAFNVNDYGKPTLPESHQNLPDLRFNLSHSNDMVVCGFAIGRDVGVDVESIDKIADITAISRHFFTTNEADFLENCPDLKKNASFFDLWTLKEAFIKAQGKGLSIPLNTFSFDMAMASPKIRFHDLEAGNASKQDEWQFFRWRPLPQATVAACVKGRSPIELIHYICTF